MPGQVPPHRDARKENDREEGELDGLDHAMSLVVNEHESVAYMVREYGGGKYQ